MMMKKGRKPKANIISENTDTRKLLSKKTANLKSSEKKNPKYYKNSKGEAFPKEKEQITLKNLLSGYEAIQGRNSERLLEIQGPITRRKEYQIMQISISKIQDLSNPDNSLLKKFDEFFKDNKNIENEMYFYRKPRVDKVLYQAEVLKTEENSHKEKTGKVAGYTSQFNFNNDACKKNTEKNINEKASENNCENYFDNVTENGENIKEKNYHEENENKNYKNSKYVKTEVNEASMPIIDLEDAHIKMELEENELDDTKVNRESGKREMRNENYLKSYDEIDRENNYLKKYTTSKSILGHHNQITHKSYRNYCTKNFDNSKINKEDLNYYMKFIEFYKNSQDFGNVILKGSQDFELLALELLRDSNYSISLALKQILYPIVDYLEEDESEKDFDVPYNFYQNNFNGNNLLGLHKQQNHRFHNGFESAHDLRRLSNDITNNLNNINDNSNLQFNGNYNSNQKHFNSNVNSNFKLYSETSNSNNLYNNNICSNFNNNNSNQNFESITSYSPQSSSKLQTNPNQKAKQEVADLYVNSALNDLIGSNMHEKTQWYQHVKTRLRQHISAQELQDLIGIAKKMKIDIPDFVLEENDKSFAFAKKIRKQLNQTPNTISSLSNSTLSDKNSLSEMTKLLADSRLYKVKYDEFSLLEDTIKKATLWRSRASEIESECVSYKTLQNIFNEGKNLPIKLENFELVKLRFTSAQQWQEKYACLPKHSKTRNNNCSQERCRMSALHALILEAEKIKFTSNEVISLKTNFEKLREFEERIFLSFEDLLLFNSDEKESLQEFLNLLDTLKFTTETYDCISAKISLLAWGENKQYYLASKSLKMKHLRNLLKDANQKNLNSLSEIRSFAKQIELMEAWLESISNVFYKEAKPEAEKIELKFFEELYKQGKLFTLKPEEIEHLLVKCEEVIALVKECEEALSAGYAAEVKKEENSDIDFEIDYGKNNDTENDKNYVGKRFCFTQLLEIKEKIEKLNVRCDVFVKVEERIRAVFQWIEGYKDFVKKLEANRDNIFNNNNNNNSLIVSENVFWNNESGCSGFNLTELFARFESENKERLNLESRHKIIALLEEYVNKNKCFYEDLLALINSAPLYVKSGTEFRDLQNIKTNSEQFMNKYELSSKLTNTTSEKNNNNNNNNDLNNSDATTKIDNFYENNNNKMKKNKIFLNSSTAISQIKQILCDSQNYCASRIFLNNLTLLFKSESWAQIAISDKDKKMNLSDAEAMLKEANNLSLEKEKLNSIKNQVQITKEWIKGYKKFLNSENLEHEKIKRTLAEGENLPLVSEEIKELQEFLQTLEADINLSLFYIKNKDFDFDQFKKFVEKISEYNVMIPKFKILEAMKNFSQEWKNIANKILQCRNLCTLYFKPKQANSNNNSLINANNFINNNEQVFLNSIENINANNSESILPPNNFEIYAEDLNSNKNKTSSVLSVSGKKRKRAESSSYNYNNNNSNQHLNTNKINNSVINNNNNNHLSLNSNRDSVSNISEDVRNVINNDNENYTSNKYNKSKYKKCKTDEKLIFKNNKGNSNVADANFESNYENDFSKDLENLDFNFSNINNNKINKNNNNKANSNKKNSKGNKNNFFVNIDTTNISDLRDSSNLASNSFVGGKKIKNYKNTENVNGINNNSNVFEQPDFLSNNFPNKKLKKAEKMQYENVLSVINSMPIKDRNNNYANFNVGNSSSRKSQNNFDISNLNLSQNEKGSYSKNQGENTGDEIILNLEESSSILNSINNNQNKNNTYNPFFELTSKKPTHPENISAKKFQNLSFIDQLNLITCSFDLKTENPSEKYCICRRGDDSLNFMIMCENCKEWFHGVCMHITKPLSSKIPTYVCLGCCKRKEISTSSYHAEFLNNKRVQFPKFLEFLEEYEFVSPYVPAYDILVGIKGKMEAWVIRYKKALREVLEFSRGNLSFFAQQIAVSFKECGQENFKKENSKNNNNNNNYGFVCEGAFEKDIKNDGEEVGRINYEQADCKGEIKPIEQSAPLAKEINDDEGGEALGFEKSEKGGEANLNANEEFEIPEQNLIQPTSTSNINTINVNNETSQNTKNTLNYPNNINLNKSLTRITDNTNSKNNNNANINYNSDYHNYNQEPINDLNENLSTSKIKSFLLSEALEKQIMDLYLESEGFPIDIQLGYNLILILKYQDWFKDAYKCMETKKYSEKLNKRVLTNYKTTFEMNQIFIAENDEEKEFCNFVFPIAQNFFEKIYLKYLENANSNEPEPNKEKAEILQQLNFLIETNPKMQGIPEYKKTLFIRSQVSTYYKLKEQLKAVVNESLTFEAYKDIYEQMLKLNFKTFFMQKVQNVFGNFDGRKFKEIRSLLFDDEKRKYKEKAEKKSKNSNCNNNNNKNEESKIDYVGKNNNYFINHNKNNDCDSLNIDDNSKAKNSAVKKIKKTEKTKTPKKHNTEINETNVCKKKDSDKMLIDVNVKDNEQNIFNDSKYFDTLNVREDGEKNKFYDVEMNFENPSEESKNKIEENELYFKLEKNNHNQIN